jgi:hypothetical protein
MSAPNIVNVTSIIAKTAVLAVTTVATDIIVNATGSNTVLKVNVLQAANINGSTATTVNASVYRSGVEYKLAHLIPVPAAASLSVIDKSTAIYLEEGDSLRLTAAANSFLHAVCSYEILA